MNLASRIRLEPRFDELGSTEWALRVAAGLVAVVILSALMLVASGHDPSVAYAALLRGAFGSERALAATLNKAVPIGLCAIGIAIANRARLWNIGAEGQLYFGAFAAAGVGLFLPETTAPVVALSLLIIAGVLAGAVWAALAALPRAFLGVSEILSTLMLTYVAVQWVDYLVTGPWADPRTFSFPYSAPIISSARIGDLIGQVHWGILLLLLAALTLLVIDRRLRWGYALRVFGDAPMAAKYAGIDGRCLVLTALIVAGCFAGLAGAVEIAASTNRLQAGLSP
ncbi:MAG: ABC transporter permease [Pseudomonadota bacterium]